MVKPKKGVVPKQLEGWTMVLDDVRKKNPHLSYKEAMVVAKPIYHALKKKLGI